MKYEKIIKWILVALFVVGVVFSFYGFAVGFESNGNAPVDNILYCAYAFAAVAILAVLFGVVVIGGMNNPKSLLKLFIGLVACAVIVAGAYLLAQELQPWDTSVSLCQTAHSNLQTQSLILHTSSSEVRSCLLLQDGL